MPVLESTDKVAPRSVLRHRPLNEPGRGSVATAHPITQRASRARPQSADDDSISEWKRGDAEEGEFATVLPRKSESQPGRGQGHTKKVYGIKTHGGARRLAGFRVHPLFLLGLGMLTMLVLWTLLTAGINWWNTTMDNIHYGYPRLFQTDAVVGHNDSASNPSHFLALNFHGRIEIIEFPGGDGSHSRIYLGPQLFGSNADLAPVTLKFADVNGDHRPDMLVFFQSSWIVFINNQGTFQPPTEQEHQDAVRYLALHRQT